MLLIANNIFLFLGNFVLIYLTTAQIFPNEELLKISKISNQKQSQQTEKVCRYGGRTYEKGEKVTTTDGKQIICKNPPNWELV